MTPGSMINFCYSDGKCDSVEGGTLSAIVDKLKAAGKLASVRDVNTTMFSAPIAVADLIAAFGQITKLTLRVEDALDLTPLVGVASLRELTLRKASPAMLSAVTKLTQLETLDLDEGSFTKLGDVSALGKLRKLTLNGAALTSLVGVEKLPLKGLEFARTKITDLSPLRAMTTLESLRISDTRVHDLKPLTALVALKAIDAARSAIVDVTPLAKHDKLRDLNLEETNVKSITALRGLPGLAFLYLTKGTISATEIDAFTKATPDCKIVF